MMKITRRRFAFATGAALVAPVLQPASGSEDPLHEFEQFLSKDELERIRKDLAESAPFLQKLRDVKLQNGDEPDFTFVALARR